MKHLIINTSLYTFNEFIKENNNNTRLDKFIRIKGPTVINKYLLEELKTNEMFDTEYDFVDYKTYTYNHPAYIGEFNYKLVFKSNSNTEYRLDLILLRENPNDVKHIELKNKDYYSIGFTLKHATDLSYDNQTYKNEQFDVLNRLKWILNDFKDKYNLNDVIFMFGDPLDERKLNMYEYIISKCFSYYRILVDYTSKFNSTKKGFYLIK